MALRSLPKESVRAISSILEDACADPSTDLPFANAIIIGNGKHTSADLLAYHTKPNAVNGDGLDTVQWLASCTKLPTAIACMQLLQDGRANLDDEDFVEDICPELNSLKVIQDDGSFVEKKNKITLRMLLTHTAGFGYSFMNPPLKSFDEFTGDLSQLQQPLLFQPGERFQYGISMDWAGLVVERVSGLKLNDYFVKHIFKPLGIRELNMFPSEEMLSRSSGMWSRQPDGRLVKGEYPLKNYCEPGAASNLFNLGGSGLWGTTREFSKIVAAVLHGGVSLHTGQRILSESAVDEMISTNQLQQWPNLGRQATLSAKPYWVHPSEGGINPLCPPEKPQGWSFGGFITPSVTGRSDTTVQWGGVTNVFWWVDREKDVAGVVGSEVLPFADLKAAEMWVKVETEVYKGLEEVQ